LFTKDYHIDVEKQQFVPADCKGMPARPLSDPKQQSFEELGHQRGADWHDRDREQECEVDPRQVAVAADRMIGPCMLTNPEDTERKKDHEKDHEPRRAFAQQCLIGLDCMLGWDIEIQHHQRHRQINRPSLNAAMRPPLCPAIRL